MGFLQDNFIADFFKWSIEQLYGLVGSYGWSIVIITVAFRLLVLPLDIKSKRNARRQQQLQPKIKAIQNKYANDKETLNRKTQELYKSENFNPMAGCLPMLIQMPVFFAFFGALRYIGGTQILEMYEAAAQKTDIVLEGFLWVKNLWQADTFNIGISAINSDLIPTFRQIASYNIIKDSGITEAMYNGAMDPYIATFKASGNANNGLFILPVAATILSFFQSKLAMPAKKEDDEKKSTDAPPSAMNGKMMLYMMPVMSLVICTTTSAAYALYWTMSNVVSVANYLVMNKVFAREDAHAALTKETEKPSRKMERKLPKI